MNHSSSPPSYYRSTSKARSGSSQSPHAAPMLLTAPSDDWRSRALHAEFRNHNPFEDFMILHFDMLFVNFLFTPFQDFPFTVVVVLLGLFTTYIGPIPGFDLQRAQTVSAFTICYELGRRMRKDDFELMGTNYTITSWVILIWLARFFCRATGIVGINYVKECCGLIIFVGTMRYCMKTNPHNEAYRTLMAVAGHVFMLPSIGHSALAKGNIHTSVHSGTIYCAQTICTNAPFVVGVVLLLITIIPKSMHSADSEFSIHRILLRLGALATGLEIAALCIFRTNGAATPYEIIFFLTLAAFYTIVSRYANVVASSDLGPSVGTKGCSHVEHLESISHKSKSICPARYTDAEAETIMKYTQVLDDILRTMREDLQEIGRMANERPPQEVIADLAEYHRVAKIVRRHLERSFRELCPRQHKTLAWYLW